jgi:ABC-2 type transport system ATP-binding protein
LILDEPTSGLDPVNQNVLRDTILNAKAAGRTVIFSTHNMDQAEQLCDSVCIIAGGKKVLDGQLRDIRRTHSSRRYRVEFESVADAAKADPRLQAAPFANVDLSGERCEFELASNASASDALAALAQLNCSITEFTRVQSSLHDIFVSYAGGAAIATRRGASAHD